MYRTRLAHEFESESTHFLESELSLSSFSVEFYNLADFDGSIDDFQLRRIGRDKVAGEASRSVRRTSPRAENENCALRHVVGVA